jgi:hypothetical protein
MSLAAAYVNSQRIGISLLCVALSMASTAQGESVARSWNEANLDAIRGDFPHPAVHARNLFHVSVAMWDAWAAYDETAVGYVHNESAIWTNIPQARDVAVSYAGYRVLAHRYALSVSSTQTLDTIAALMGTLGYDTNVTTTLGNSPAAVGNRTAAAILSFAQYDGSLETNNYEDASYTPTNEPLILQFSGTTLIDPNRWQPLAFDVAITQNGQEADKIQTFLGAQWGNVRPFALTRSTPGGAYHDPGPPPNVGGVGDAQFKSNNLAVIRFSSFLDPDDGVMVDISPGGPSKNNALGTHDGTGHPTNPVTGSAYVSNIVKRADFGRVIAEFWADGPASETPPGHWNTLANAAEVHPLFSRRFEGQGAVLDELEWDVKTYFTLNAAMHDAATSAWTLKRIYDYIRPISTIRWLSQNGQSSDPGGDSYHTNGIFLESNLVEVVSVASSSAGQRHEHLNTNLGEIAIHAWPGEPTDPSTQYSGKAWILARDWLPYQRDTFVTPAFAGYVSGHSCFSRAGAEVLTAMTGDPFFPGGFGSYTAQQASLDFEYGPSEDIVLEWGTYYDAADEAGISRLYGGIHVAPDDGPGRIMGSKVGKTAFALAKKYFDGSITNEPFICRTALVDQKECVVSWDQFRGLHYRVESSSDPNSGYGPATSYQQAEEATGQYVATGFPSRLYFRVRRAETPGL